MYAQNIEGPAWSVTGTTGTMAAALAQDSLVYAIGAVADPTPGVSQTIKRAPLEIQGIQVTFTAIVAATTPVLAGRRLQLFKNSTAAGVMPTGGTALAPLPKRTLDQATDNGLIGSPGIARIATTAGLTVGSFVRGSVPSYTIDLTGAGAAGSRIVWEFDELVNGAPLWLDPGEVLVISNPQAIDAALTWQLTVNVDYRARCQM